VRARQRRTRLRDAQRAQRQLGRAKVGHRGSAGARAAAASVSSIAAASARRPSSNRRRAAIRRACAALPRSACASSVADAAASAPRRAGEVAHRQRHLGLGDDATRLRQLLVCAEGPRGALEQFARTRVVAQLRHGDAAQGQRRRVVAQRDALERAERVSAASARAEAAIRESMAQG